MWERSHDESSWAVYGQAKRDGSEPSLDQLPNHKLLSLRNVVAHADADGVASALLLLWSLPKLHSCGSFQFVQYDTPDHVNLTPQVDTIFADFSPHPDQAGAWKDYNPVILDHHKSQEELVRSFRFGVYGGEKGDCGATLVYKHVTCPVLTPVLSIASAFLGSNATINANIAAMRHLARMASVRDTWQTDHEDWNEACGVKMGLEFWDWDTWSRTYITKWDSLLRVGKRMFEGRMATVEELAEQAHRFEAGGLRVAAFPRADLVSDVANIIDDSADLVVGFAFPLDSGPRIVYSIRSHTGFDCAAFAKHYGGGGHKAAAGFRVDLTRETHQPYELLRSLILDYPFLVDPEGSHGKRRKTDQSNSA